MLILLDENNIDELKKNNEIKLLQEENENLQQSLIGVAQQHKDVESNMQSLQKKNES